MRCLISKSHNPWFNLAIEEYFLKNSNEEIFLLYINEPCIVVGKHQNLYSEINLRFSKENNIKLARRISGGGTVYQDLNNLNFSFIHNCKNIEHTNFSKFIQPILESLIHLGIDAKFSERNDLLIGTKKISGNAMHIYKSRVLSHGTLLFNTNLDQLSVSLKNNSSNYTDKSIKSVKSKVANISEYMGSSKTMDEFTEDIFQCVVHNSISSNPLLNSLTDDEAHLIEGISKEKYETWDWIYGYSPKYVFKNNCQLSELTITLELSVERGIIINSFIKIDEVNDPIYSHALKIIVNARHDIDSIVQILSSDHIINSATNFNISEFCYQLF